MRESFLVFFSLRLCTWLCRSVIIKLNFPLVVLAGLCIKED
jgi:hypothetical protein